MLNFFFKNYFYLKYKIIRSYHFRIKRKNLKTWLLSQNKTKWLDIGSSKLLPDTNFKYLDIFDPGSLANEIKKIYFQVDITKPILNDLGKFDFIRLQHVFEHFTYEEADIVLENISKLLNKNGILLITVPSLDIFISRYITSTIEEIPLFKSWANTRILKQSPKSDYFSIFTHSVLYEQHKWCYNQKGLINKINKSNNFVNIKKLHLFHNLSSIPFTHNRPEQDLCVIAKRK